MVFIRNTSTAIRVVDQRRVDLGCRVVNGDGGIRKPVCADERDAVRRVGCECRFRNSLLAAIGDGRDKELGCGAFCTSIDGENKPVCESRFGVLLRLDIDGAREIPPVVACQESETVSQRVPEMMRSALASMRAALTCRAAT
jgi:hypothetical protein